MDDVTPERWLPVPDYEGLYEVSDLGRVRSLPRRGGRNRSYGGVLLKPHKAIRGSYPSVRLSRVDGGQTVQVHILVAAAFIGPRPEGEEVRHLDGDPGNCVLVNLTYGTRSENEHDKITHGTNPNARKTHCIRGHEFTPENTILRPNGGRACRRCHMLSTWKRRGKVPDSPRKPPAPRTHCKRGHEFTPANTYYGPDGRRQCRACIRLRKESRTAA